MPAFTQGFMPRFMPEFVLGSPVADDALQLHMILMGYRVALEAALYGIVDRDISISRKALQAPRCIIDYMAWYMKDLRAISEMVGYPRDTPRCFRVKKEVLRDLYGLLSFIAHPGGPSDDELRDLAFSTGVYFLDDMFRDFARNLMLKYTHESMPKVIHDMAQHEVDPSGVAAPPGDHVVPLVESYENDGMEIDLPVAVPEGTSDEAIRFLAGVSC